MMMAMTTLNLPPTLSLSLSHARSPSLDCLITLKGDSSLTQIPDGRQASASCGSDNQRAVKTVNIQQTKRGPGPTHIYIQMHAHTNMRTCSRTLNHKLKSPYSDIFSYIHYHYVIRHTYTHAHIYLA